MIKKSFFLLCMLFFSLASSTAATIYKHSQPTVVALEMNIGDTLYFELNNKTTRRIILLETSVKQLVTNLTELKKRQLNGGLIYGFTCVIDVDGQPMKLQRFVSCQQSFYEPYVINGMRIWFDAVKTISDLIQTNHVLESKEAVPLRDARFVIGDMVQRIAPIPLYLPYDNFSNYIDISNSYNGDDCWLGAFAGYDLHGGLDINMPIGTANYSPFSSSNHYLFHSVASGDGNNRWRIIKEWDTGDKWTFQIHHINNLLKNPYTPVNGGQRIADAAGVFYGDHPHAHYVFKITPKGDAELMVDPWILFWQVFEDRKLDFKPVSALFNSLSPSRTGQEIILTDKSTYVGDEEELTFLWSFGDGTYSTDRNPTHIFAKPGVYAIRLQVSNGSYSDHYTQCVTINGAMTTMPAMIISCDEEESFDVIQPEHVEIYNSGNDLTSATLQFTARATRPVPDRKIVDIKNNSLGKLDNVVTKIKYENEANWINIMQTGYDNLQRLQIGVDATGLLPGVYRATIAVESGNAINPTTEFRVQLLIPSTPPFYQSKRSNDYIVDNEDRLNNRFYASSSYWFVPQFKKWKKGYKESYASNGGLDSDGYARFRPDLKKGKYDVLLHPLTPFDSTAKSLQFWVRVRSSKKDTCFLVNPQKTQYLGNFAFDEGTDGFVDIISKNSGGEVLADAIIFRFLDDSEPVNDKQNVSDTNTLSYSLGERSRKTQELLLNPNLPPDIMDSKH